MAQPMVWRPIGKMRIPNNDPKHDNFLVVRDGGGEIITWENKSGGVGIPFNPPDSIRLCQLVPADAPDALTVVMTPEIRETLRDIIIHVQRRYPEAPKQADWAEALAYLDSLKGATNDTAGS